MSNRLLVLASALILSCGGTGGQRATEEIHLRRCQAGCDQVCTIFPHTSESYQTCVNRCLGYTDGLSAECAQCVVDGIRDYCGDGTQFNSPSSAECLPLCSGRASDAGSSETSGAR
jgi:hypothetical protein